MNISLWNIHSLAYNVNHRKHTNTLCEQNAELWVCGPLLYVDCVWNVMAHAQKPDFIFRRNWRVHLNRQGASVQSTTGSQGVRISGSNAGYTMFRGSVKGTGYPLHSPVSHSLPLPALSCAITFQQDSTNQWALSLPRALCFLYANWHTHFYMWGK